jgi:hypothetical protein
MTERTPCREKTCKHYYSDGSYCIEVGCFGGFPGEDVFVKDCVPSIAGGMNRPSER